LGGGDTPLQGINAVNVDVRPAPEVDIVRNLEEDFSDVGRFDGLYASYVAEHVSWRKIQQFFKSCFNVLTAEGVAVFVVPNTLEQMKKVVDKDLITLDDSQFIFGDQDYSENSHKVAFSKPLIDHLLREAGFNEVKIVDHPNQEARDIIVEAHKAKKKTATYDRAYFEDPSDGYVGYWDFPVHLVLTKEIVNMKPKSVLDLGGARGYITKRLEAEGIRAVCMDVSEYCWHTRATDSFVLHDATDVPWPFKDGEFDLVVSLAFLEHIEEEQLKDVIREISRVSKRSFHNVAFTHEPSDIDSTHVSFKSKEEWQELFKRHAPEHHTEITGKVWFDERLNRNLAIYTSPNKKLNFGCFTIMFYGWTNVDIEDLGGWARENGYEYVRADARERLPFKDNEAGFIVSHHMIEHLTREEGINFLRECYRILEPGGVIRLSTPDLNGLAEDYVSGNIMQYSPVNVAVENAKDDDDAFFQILFYGHKTLYRTESLRKALREVGFIEDRAMPFNKSRSEVIQHETVDSYPTLSIYCEAIKPRGLAQTANRDEPIYKYLRGE